MSRRLQHTLTGSGTSSNADDGGLKQQPSLFDDHGNRAAPAPSNDLAVLDDDFDGSTDTRGMTDRSINGSPAASSSVQRAHAINNADNRPDLLPEF